MLIRIGAVVAALAVAVGAAGCGGGGGGDGGGKAVKVGGIFDLSGATADVGKPYADGVKDFVKQWNAQGKTPKLDLVSGDYKYDVAVAERLYSRLRTQGVVAVQGWGTGDTEALRGRITADRLPFMSASYAETLTNPGETPFNFVVATSYSDQMRIALQWISEQASGAQVAFFRHDSPFGESPLKAGEEKAKELGLGFKDYAMPAEATDYVPQLRRAKAQGAKYVVIQNVSTPAAQLAKNISEQGLDMQVVCLNWCADELFVDLAGKAADGVVGVTPFVPVDAQAAGLKQPSDVLSQQGSSLSKEGLHYVQGWYTMEVMAEGIAKAAEAGNVDGPAVQKALQDLGPVDTGGVSAPIDFTADSHAGMKASKLYQVKNGKWTELTDLQPVQ